MRNIVVIVALVLGISSCTINSNAPDKPDNLGGNNSTPGQNFSTLPGNNFFNLTSGGFTLLPKDTTNALTLNGTKGRCDITGNNYVVSLSVESGMVGYLNVYFNEKPAVSDSFVVQPYVGGAILPGTTQITANIINTSRTYHAVKGKIAVVVSDNGRIEVSFTKLPIENLYNYTDTTYTHISGNLFCY